MPSIAQLEKLLSLDPADPFVYYCLAQEHAKAGDHDQAIVSYAKVIELDSTYCYAYFFQGQSLQELGDMDQAKQVVAQGIEIAKQTNEAKAISELTGLLESMQ